MPLTPEEEEALRKQILQELEVEHESRTSIAQKRLGKMQKTSISEEFQKEKDVNKLKSELRRAFYEQNGYIKTTDEHGFTIWMTKEEINIQRIRQKNAHNRYTRPKNPDAVKKRARQKLLKSVPLILGAIVIGAIVGLILVNSGG